MGLDARDLYSCLSSSQALRALVGERIYNSVAPQDTRGAYVVFTPTGSVRFPTAGDGMPCGYPAFQIDIYAQRVADVAIIGDEIQNALRGAPMFHARMLSDQGITTEQGTELFRHSAEYRLW